MIEVTLNFQGEARYAGFSSLEEFAKDKTEIDFITVDVVSVEITSDNTAVFDIRGVMPQLRQCHTDYVDQNIRLVGDDARFIWANRRAFL